MANVITCRCGSNNVTKVKNGANSYACHDCGRIFLINAPTNNHDNLKGETKMKELTTKPLTEEELKVAEGGVTVGSPVLGHYRCYKCGGEDFHVITADARNVYVACKRCGSQSKIGEN